MSRFLDGAAHISSKSDEAGGGGRHKPAKVESLPYNSLLYKRERRKRSTGEVEKKKERE